MAPGMYEDRIHLCDQGTRDRMALCPVADGNEIPEILAGKCGERVLVPPFPPDINPELAERFFEEGIVGMGERVPFGGRRMPYLLDRGLNRFFPEELEPPSAQPIIAGVAHNYGLSELFRSGQ